MASVDDLRAGLASALRTALPDIQVNEYVTSSPMPPGIEIDLDPEGVNYDQAMGRGLDEWFFVARGYVASAFDIGAQRRRDEWLASSGTGSVKAAIETDRTLAGVCQVLRVLSAQPREFASAASPNTSFVGAEWRIQVMATG